MTPRGVIRLQNPDVLDMPVGFGPYARNFTWYQVALIDPRHVLRTREWLEGFDSVEWKNLNSALSDLFMAIVRVEVPATTTCRICKTSKAVWWISASYNTQWSEANLHVFCEACEKALRGAPHCFGPTLDSISLQAPFRHSSASTRRCIMEALTILLDLPVNPTPEQARQFLLPYLPNAASFPSG